ncbi:DUF5693 family protein [Halobacillus yeomjeoni]|uniref:DUF5693 family protein n=1 Tax=Halobacillus yeomjeoni TaxID=311194 RepID=UPI001CD554C6|nr:DUF5693 family protein [Halobacillus yeomjeoni]MCA0985206.1 DUF5693 family protein [Halobacillus yeomjeoni]
MKTHHWLWIFLIGLLLATIPSLYERWNIEVEQNDYELALPYRHIEEMADDIPFIEKLSLLKEAGLTTVMVTADDGTYPKRKINDIRSAELDIILSFDLKNSDKSFNYSRAIESYKEDGGDYIHFSGDAVPGYPEEVKMIAYAELLNDYSMGVYVTEFQALKGMKKFAEYIHYDLIRLHDMDTLHGHQSVEAKVDRTLRAIKVRNQRSILLSSMNADSFPHTIRYLENVTAEIPEQFQRSEARGYPFYKPSIGITTASLLAGLLFITLFLMNFSNRRFVYVLLVPISLALLYFITDRLLLLQTYTLLIALITPIFAIKSTADKAPSIKIVTWTFLKALGICFIGISIIITLLNGTMFYTGIELFRGVKLLYIVPLIFFIIYAFKGISIRDVKNNLNWLHWAGLFLAGLGVSYYVLRSGNSGMVSEWELFLRTKLEEILYVRPRTKEFLLGFPAYILALYVMNYNKRLGMLLLIPGVIGFLSIVNTFTHLHIPLYVSTLRSVYSILFGYLIGIFFIAAFKLLMKWKRKGS